MKTSGIALALRFAVPPEVIADFCRRHRVRRLSLFGSVLRDDFRPESDIDILVEFEPRAGVGYFGLFDMKEELGRILGRDVDLQTPMSLSPYFRDRVIREAVSLYDAA